MIHSTPKRASGGRPSLLVATKEARMGGAERMIARLLEAASEEYEVTLCVLEGDGGGSGGRDAGRGGGSGEGGGGPRAGGAIPWDGPVVEARALLQGRWDVIHTHLFLPGLLARIRRVFDSSFRWVHTVHYDDYGALRLGRLRRWLDRRWIFPAADELVAVGPAVARGLAGRVRGRVSVRTIPNAIELEAAEVGASAGAGGPVLGTVAMLRAEKGVDDLVRAVDVLRRDHPGVRLRVAGSGPEEARLRALVRSLGLGDRVELAGWVDDLDAFYASLDVYVQPSRQESFGLAALEAMRFRLPLVAAGVGYLPELLGDGEFGALVARDGPSFPERLAATVHEVFGKVEDFRTRSARGLARWSERLDPAAMDAAYLDLYRRLRAPGVCMVAPIVTQSRGGLQRQLWLQSRELHRRGYRIFVMQRRDRGLEGGRGEGSEAWSHVRFLPTPDVLPGGGEGSFRERLRGLAFLLFGSLRLLRHRHGIDLVHAHQLYSPTLVGWVGKRVAGIPLITKMTASGAYGEAAQLRDALPFFGLRRRAFRAVDRLIVLTDGMREEARSLGFPDPIIRTIPNSVEIPPEPATTTAAATGERADAPADATRSAGPFRLLFVGRLSTEKSLETLLDATELLHERGHRIAVDLVGEGDPDRNVEPDLHTHAAGMDARITFHGRRDDVAPFYRDADAFVLPSVSEGMSNSLLEAMAHGVVPVASDIAPNRFVVSHGENGLLFDQGSAESLADRVEILIRSAEGDGTELRRLAAAARRTTEARFSVGVVGERLDALYRELLER